MKFFNCPVKGEHMTKFSVRFDSDIAEKLKENADMKKITVSLYIRNLVELGLRVEESSASKSEDNDELEDAIKSIVELQKKTLRASLETLSIAKNSLKSSPVIGKENVSTDSILASSTAAAIAYMEALSDKS